MCRPAVKAECSRRTCAVCCQALNQKAALSGTAGVGNEKGGVKTTLL